jgi:hypothetical protein
MYLKVTNAAENHHGLQYVDGLNVDIIPFEREGSCCPGGIYFTTPKYIGNFLHMGCYIREVMVPEDAEMVEDHNKWRASKVILGERRDLRKVETWKWLVEAGVNVPECFIFMCKVGRLDIIKYLVESSGVEWGLFS